MHTLKSKQSNIALRSARHGQKPISACIVKDPNKASLTSKKKRLISLPWGRFPTFSAVSHLQHQDIEWYCGKCGVCWLLLMMELLIDNSWWWTYLEISTPLIGMWAKVELTTRISLTSTASTVIVSWTLRLFRESCSTELNLRRSSCMSLENELTIRVRHSF